MNEPRAMDGGGRGITAELSYAIRLTERVRKEVEQAGSFKFECSELGKQADCLLQMLRSAVRFATPSGSSSAAAGAVSSSSSLYEPPIRRVVEEASRNLERALTLVRKCRGSSFLTRVFTITSVTDFRKLFASLDSSIADLRWLLSILDPDATDRNGGSGVVLSLPPIACNDPMISWVWSFIASVQMGQLPDRIEAATGLASLAKDNDRNKKIILEEGGVPPLLRLLREASSPEAQFAAATALCNLANGRAGVRAVVEELGVPLIVQVLGNSPMRVQAAVSNLVARMAEHDPLAQEDFARENAIRPLVSMLSLQDEPAKPQPQPLPPPAFPVQHSNHSSAQSSRSMEKNSSMAPYRHPPHSLSFSNGGGRGAQQRREREGEKPEVKLQLKTSCSEALWMLAKGSVLNSRRITETKGLLCLAKIIEKEKGELQTNCLMTVTEITTAAESDAELRRAAFRANSPAAKAVVEQLLRVIGETDDPSLLIPAIKAIGSLARTFPAKETRVVGPLVAKLSHDILDVAVEAVMSLSKFASPENFLCVEHSKSIIDFHGVPPLLRLLRRDERTLIRGLVLLCYLALHAGNSEALNQARVLRILEDADGMLLSQHPELKDLVYKAVSQLYLYHPGGDGHPW